MRWIAPSRHRFVALSVAIASIVAWLALLTIADNRLIADEEDHVSVIQRIANGDWAALTEPPMLPGFHLVAAAWLRGWSMLLGWPMDASIQLPMLRAFNALAAIAGVLIATRVLKVMRANVVRGIRNGDPRAPGALIELRTDRGDVDAILRFSWNPILFPFACLVYTDVPALVLLIAALLFHMQERWWLSAAMLFLACVLRQTNIVWVTCFAAIALADARRAGAGWSNGLRRAIWQGLPRVWPHALVFALVGSAFLVRGRLTMGSAEFNRPAFNPAQFYLFALFVGLLWLPIWVRRGSGVWRELGHKWLTRPAGCVALVAAVALVIIAFRSPHAWNYDMHYVRNWPLEGMANSLLARAVGAVLIVALAPVVVAFTRSQRRRLELAIVWAFAGLFLLPHAVAEPRYYIVPVVLLNLLAEFPEKEGRGLTGWYAIVCAAICAYTLKAGSLAGGVW